MPAVSLPPSAVPVIERWQLVLHPERPLEHVEQTGSMLRGVFGHALKALVCRCPGASHDAGCLYQRIFEPQPPADWPLRYRDCPPAFVISPPQAAQAHQRLPFALTLLGPAVRHAELIWTAWQMAAFRGLGNRQIPARIQRTLESGLPPTPGATTSVRLRFDSPLHLKRKNPGEPESHVLGPEDLSLADLLIALHRRLEITQQLYGMPQAPLPPLKHWLEQAQACDVRQALRQVHFSRRSNRQQRRVPLQGVCGEIVVHGALDEGLRAALSLGQWLHIGGKTALGMGGYRLLGSTPPALRLSMENTF